MGKGLKLKSRWGRECMVELTINYYLNNGCMSIHLMDQESKEPFSNLTVNLGTKVPAYCGYVDTNHLPEALQFIEEHNLGEFTSIVGLSGFCEYPLYMFNADRLRELCPDGMAEYERSIGMTKEATEQEKSR